MFHDPIGQSHIEVLANEVRKASAMRRLELQPKFSRMIADMQRSGQPVPARLRNLHEQLLEEAIEARFDNLPV